MVLELSEIPEGDRPLIAMVSREARESGDPNVAISTLFVTLCYAL